MAERDGNLAALRGQIAGLFEQFGTGGLSPGGLLERLRGLGVEVRCSQEQLEASLRRITAPGCVGPLACYQDSQRPAGVLGMQVCCSQEQPEASLRCVTAPGCARLHEQRQASCRPKCAAAC